MRRATLAVICLLATSVATPACAGLFASAIYPAPNAPLEASALPAGALLVDVTTEDGLTLRGILAPPADDQPIVLALPGNASSAGDALAWTAALRERGYGVMAVGYRGYSGNPGRPSAAGLAKDADAFLLALRERYPERPLWIIGHSVGGAVALDLAARRRPAALITWGAFTTLRDMAPALGRALVPDEYRNIDRVRGLDAPWLLVHGTADGVVPASHGEALHVAAGEADLSGASFVGIGLEHAVDAALLGDIVAAGMRFLEDGDFDTDGLPPSLKLIPFGQSKPLNP